MLLPGTLFAPIAQPGMLALELDGAEACTGKGTRSKLGGADC